MAYLELAIDLGTSYTSIYQKGMGLILREPSVVVAQNGNTAKSIKAIGVQAKKLIGKTPENTTVIFPIFEGAIINSAIATVMLEYFLNKVMPASLVKPKVRALVNIPCGLNASERKLFENVIYGTGVREAIFLEAPISAAFGMAAPLTKSEPCLIVDIGGGTTDIGVLSLNGIIAGCSVGIGGNNVDTGIIDHLADNHSIKVGLLSTERVKLQAGSLYVNDTTTSMINGRDTITQNPRSMILTSKDLSEVVQYYYYKILDVIESVIHMLPEEVGAEIYQTGVYLCGGGSQIAGIERAFNKYLNLEITTMEEPSYAAILGCGKLLADRDALECFIEKKD